MLRVKKRDGELEEADFSKVTNRIKFLCLGELRDGTVIGESLDICHAEIARNVISTITDKISTRELDEYAARLCAGKVDENAQYSVLAGRLAISNHQKNTLSSFADTMKLLYENCDNLGRRRPLLRKSFMKDVSANRDAVESMIDYTRDYNIDYFGYMTLLKSYFLRRITPSIEVYERPQHVYMRIAIALYGRDLERVKETYDLLSLGYLSHASPTMFNAGTTSEQLSSCFLLGIKDSMDDDGGIPDCWKSCARISKRAGGIGVGITPIRAEGSMIYGVNGPSDGIIPMCRVFDNIACYVNQGGRRNGSFAMYLEPWHPDIYAFLDLKKNHGKEEARARDLFYALWMCDLFMERLLEAVQNNKPVKWSLMCPNDSHKAGNPRLYEAYGTEFKRIYEEYERDGLAIRVIDDIRDLWFEILRSQKETGTPYMLYKDQVNLKNNQSNLGTIRNSNLCAEIVEYSDEKEHAVCNLASIVLHKFVKTNEDGKVYYDYAHLLEVCKVALRNLNIVIDINFYPTPETKRSNMKHRPVGLGVQGLADVFIRMKQPFESPEAAETNRKIFETIYFACMTRSMEISHERYELFQKHSERLLALTESDFVDEYQLHEKVVRELDGLRLTRAELERFRAEPECQYVGAYSSFEGSPISQGKFQFDLWREHDGEDTVKLDTDLAYDWDSLREKITRYGVRNSLTTAVMPTASTASILKSVECIEPFKYNIYTRRVLSGEFILMNQYLQSDLMKLDLWTHELRRKLVANRGSVQDIDEIPRNIKELYKTAFEIKQKTIIDLARDRAPFIDQTQSMNLFVAEPTNKILTSMHLYTAKQKLKTGMYYLRRQAKAQPIAFTVDQEHLIKSPASIRQDEDEEEECLNCGS